MGVGAAMLKGWLGFDGSEVISWGVLAMELYALKLIGRSPKDYWDRCSNAGVKSLTVKEGALHAIDQSFTSARARKAHLWSLTLDLSILLPPSKVAQAALDVISLSCTTQDLV